MKQTIKIFAVAMMLAIMPLAQCQDFSYTVSGGQTLYFNIVDGDAILTRPADTTLPYFSQLGNLIIPDTVEFSNIQYVVAAIDSDAFAGCSGLTQVTIPATVTAIGRRAFDSVIDLTRTNYTGTLAQWCVIDFAGYTSNPVWFSGNLYVDGNAVTVNSFTDVIPEIKRLAFAGCTTLSGTLTLPATTTTIGVGAFYQCTGITSVELPNSIMEIGDHAFRDCSGIVSVNLPEGLENVGHGAFNGCTSLQNITIPRTIKHLGYNTFSHCSSLNTVWFNADSCSAGKTENGLIYPIFGSGCTSLTSIVFGGNVKVIPDYAFAFSRHITEITIPDSVISIGKASFQTCNLVSSISIGKNVQSIGDSAFGWCSELWQFNMRCTTPPTYGFRSLYGIGNNVRVYVPCEAVETYENNGQWGMFDIEGQIVYRLNLFSDDESKGNVSVIEHATCANPVATVQATALDGYSFSHWSDGNTYNPRQIVMNQDITLTAFFNETNGIDQVSSADNVIVYTKGRSIVVVTDKSMPVLIYDIMGRNISKYDACGETCCRMQNAGVFFVKVGDLKAQKTVVF